MEIERKWLIDGFPAGLPLLKEARVRRGYISTAPWCASGERERRRLPLCAVLQRAKARWRGRRLKRIFLRNCSGGSQPSRAGPCDQGLQGVCAARGRAAGRVSLVDAGRPTAFFSTRRWSSPPWRPPALFVPPPFLGEEKTESGDFSMSAYWHATRGSGREG